MEYRIVYDVAWQPYNGIYLYVGLGMAFAGILSVTRSWQVGELLDRSIAFVRVFGGIILFFALVMVVLHFSHAASYRRYLRAIQHGECTVVEGPVEDFVPMPHGGHAHESFTVRGVPYHYSDFEETEAFNNTSSHGGPIRSGLHVRIHSIAVAENENRILRLEVKQ